MCTDNKKKKKLYECEGKPFKVEIADSHAFFSWPCLLMSLSARIFSKALTMNISRILFRISWTLPLKK